MKKLGCIGLGVMGAALSQNMVGAGYEVHGFDPKVSRVRGLSCHSSLSDLIGSLGEEKIILMMVPASAVDEIFSQCLDLLVPGDVLIDGGNSHFLETGKRGKIAEEKGILYLGLGISGGEDGARTGPSMMAGGDPLAWEKSSFLLKRIAAKNSNGMACVEWLGKDGAGHLIKTVHNGIEYAEMQLLAELYGLTKFFGWDRRKIKGLFDFLAEDLGSSYLVDISRSILAWVESNEETPLIEHLSGRLNHNRTGTWTVQLALDLGVPVPSISAAVEARFLSKISQRSGGNPGDEAESEIGPWNDDEYSFHALKQSWLGARILLYLQGFMVLEAAGITYDLDLKLKSVLPVWSAGCIIRSALLDKLPLGNIVTDVLSLWHDNSWIQNQLNSAYPLYSSIMKYSTEFKVWMPCFSATFNYLQALRQTTGMELVEAQRDFFGHHGFVRADDPLGRRQHSPWGKDIKATD